eukprot:242447-Hanusia_phi.AAC.2
MPRGRQGAPEEVEQVVLKEVNAKAAEERLEHFVSISSHHKLRWSLPTERTRRVMSQQPLIHTLPVPVSEASHDYSSCPHSAPPPPLTHCNPPPLTHCTTLLLFLSPYSTTLHLITLYFSLTCEMHGRTSPAVSTRCSSSSPPGHSHRSRSSPAAGVCMPTRSTDPQLAGPAFSGDLLVLEQTQSSLSVPPVPPPPPLSAPLSLPAPMLNPQRSQTAACAPLPAPAPTNNNTTLAPCASLRRGGAGSRSHQHGEHDA